MIKLSVGCSVHVKKCDDPSLTGKVGEVVWMYESPKVQCILVQFDKIYTDVQHNGHSAFSGLPYLEGSRCYYFYPSELEVVNICELPPNIVVDEQQPSGGSTPSQYRLSINLPLTSNREEFVDVDVEAMDIIDALNLSGNMKDVLKAMWRMGKKENTTTEYDFNKMVFFILREQYRQGIITHEQFWQKVKAVGVA